jgi:hypothetical protein
LRRCSLVRALVWALARAYIPCALAARWLAGCSCGRHARKEMHVIPVEAIRVVCPTTSDADATLTSPPIASAVLAEMASSRGLAPWAPFVVSALPFRHAACKVPSAMGGNAEAVHGACLFGLLVAL